jgi:hypothetical protein
MSCYCIQHKGCIYKMYMYNFCFKSRWLKAHNIAHGNIHPAQYTEVKYLLQSCTVMTKSKLLQVFCVDHTPWSRVLLEQLAGLQQVKKYPTFYGTRVGPVSQSVWRLTTGWTVWGSNPGGDEIFRTHLDRHWGPPSLQHKGYQIFPGLKRPGRGADHPPPPSARLRMSRAIALLPL